MITKTKKLNTQTSESMFINRVCQTCGLSFVADATGFDVLLLKDFVLGRKKPRPTDMTKFIDALGLFNRLTMCEVAA